MNLISQPWPWYISGVLIGLIVPLTLVFGNKPFGISSSLRHICAMLTPKKIDYFNYNWKKEKWNLFFVSGIILGAFFASSFLQTSEPLKISDDTKLFLTQYKINNFSSVVPPEIFSWKSLLTPRGFIFIVCGGFFVGFGTRYAGGCTSGHCISGLSNFQLPSLVATISFMLGGIICSWFILPYLLNL